MQFLYWPLMDGSKSESSLPSWESEDKSAETNMCTTTQSVNFK